MYVDTGFAREHLIHSSDIELSWQLTLSDLVKTPRHTCCRKHKEVPLIIKSFGLDKHAKTTIYNSD